MSTIYKLSDGARVSEGDIVELVDGPLSMLLFGDSVIVHRVEVRADGPLSPGQVPVWHHPFMLSFPADWLRRVETRICAECDRGIPADEGDDSPWHGPHGRPCARCGDLVQTLSSRDWCDGCEGAAPSLYRGQIVRLKSTGELIEVWWVRDAELDGQALDLAMTLDDVPLDDVEPLDKLDEIRAILDRPRLYDIARIRAVVYR